MKTIPWIIDNLLRLFVVGFVLLVTTILVMFLVLKVDLTVQGRGVVRCNEWLNVKAEIEGVIKQVNVVEGQWVKRGTPLFWLERRELELDVEESELKIKEHTSTAERIRRQLVATKLSVEAEVEEARAMESEAGARLRIIHRGAKPEEINLAEGRVKRAKEYYLKATMDLERKKKSLALKIIPRQDLEEAQHKKRLAQVDLSLAQDDLALLLNKYDANDIAEAQAELEAAAARTKRVLARRNEPLMLQDDLDQIQTKLQKEKKRLKVYQQRLELTTVRAPISGTILTHEPEHLAGKGVSEGTTVIRMGDCKKFNIDCNISERDIPLVMEGQQARVQVKPFPKGEYKLFAARVIGIGADVKETAVKGDNLGKMLPLSPVKEAEGVYPVLLELHEPYSIYVFDELYSIKPGFSTEVEIITCTERLATALLRRVLRIGGNVKPDNLHL